MNNASSRVMSTFGVQFRLVRFRMCLKYDTCDTAHCIQVETYFPSVCLERRVLGQGVEWSGWKQVNFQFKEEKVIWTTYLANKVERRRRASFDRFFVTFESEIWIETDYQKNIVEKISVYCLVLRRGRVPVGLD